MTPTGRRRTDSAPIRRILLVRPRRIGDIVLTTPAAAAVRAAFPDARLTYLAEAPYARLVAGNPVIDEVIAVEPHQGPIAFVRLAARLRREHFDAAIDFHGGPRAARLTRLSGARIRVGYEIPGRRYHVRVPRGSAGAPVHSVVNHVNLVRALVRAAIPHLSLPESEAEVVPALSLPEADAAEKQRVARFLSEHGASSAKLVVMHVGAGNRFRDWGEANWIELARQLVRVPGVRVVLAGGREDRARAAAFSRDSKLVLDATGVFNLIELLELISRARLFVGPDSGPMHIAAATKTPIVAIFGPTLPAHFAPWRREAVRILEKSVPCRPCRQRRCDRDYECLSSTSADEVLAACREFLD